MKNKIIYIIGIIFLLSGCVKSTTTMTIDSNKSFDLESTFLVSNYFSEIDILNEIDKEKITSKGFNVSSDIKDGEYAGIKIYKKYKNIDNVSNETGETVIISDLMDGTIEDNVLFKVKKSFFKNTYTANFKYRLRSEIFSYSNDDIELNNDKLITLDGEMYYKYIVKLPYVNLSNNANEVSKDGKTLTWNLNRSKDSDIKFVFSLYNWVNIIIVSGVGLIVLIALIIVIVKLSKKHKKEKINDAPILVDYDPSIEEDLENFEPAPEVASQSENNKISDNQFEYKLPEEEKAKEIIVQAKITPKIEERKPVFIDKDAVEEIIDFTDEKK